MKILLLGKGAANDGCKRLLEKHLIEYDYFNINEIVAKHYDYIVKSPGIKLTDNVFNYLKGRVISDIELGYILEKPFVIGITGSNGKTSVTLMLKYILSKKYKVCACGNIGYSFCDALVDSDAEIFIVEVSSFQLEATRSLDCNVSVLLNISNCHLDHHTSLENYINSKMNICRYQNNDHYTVYNLDNDNLKSISRICNSRCIGFSYKNSIGKVYILKNKIYYNNKKIYRIKEKESKYRHKIENYLAVLSVVSLFKINLKKAAKKFKSFKDVDYRLNKLNDYIYNDAKSTNCASTNAALYALDKVHLICGGYNRGIQINIDKDNLNKIKYVYAYGEVKYELKFYFENNNIKCFVFDTLEEAFRSAYIKRFENEIILYSPMFASFDQYRNYRQRGEEFNKLFFKLIKK